MQTPVFSFIVPVYNAEAFLDECLNSLIGQTFPGLEIILVDDGSTDASGELCDQYALSDKRVRAMHCKNQGVSAARNAGLQNATGTWVAFIDSDDYVATNLCETVLPFLTEAVDICTVNLDKTKLLETKTAIPTIFTGEEKNQLQYQAYHRRVKKGEWGRDFIFRSPCGKFYRRAVIQQNSLRFDTKVKMGEDALFNLYFIEHARQTTVLNCCMYFYRMHGNSTTHKYQPAVQEEMRIQLEALEKFLQQHPKPPHFAAGLNLKRIECLRDCVLSDFCHPDNPKPYRQRRKEFCALRNSAMYSNAVRLQYLKEYGVFWKVFLLLIRFRLFFLLSFATSFLRRKGKI